MRLIKVLSFAQGIFFNRIILAKVETLFTPPSRPTLINTGSSLATGLADVRTHNRPVPCRC